MPDTELAQAILQAVQDRGLTQEQQRRAGLPPQTLRDWRRLIEDEKGVKMSRAKRDAATRLLAGAQPDWEEMLAEEVRATRLRAEAAVAEARAAEQRVALLRSCQDSRTEGTPGPAPLPKIDRARHSLTPASPADRGASEPRQSE